MRYQGRHRLRPGDPGRDDVRTESVERVVGAIVRESRPRRVFQLNPRQKRGTKAERERRSRERQVAYRARASEPD